MGKFLDSLLGKDSERKKYENYVTFKQKYRKEAMKEYKSDSLEGWLDERVEIDLKPDDYVKKYRADLKRWFLRTKEAYNSRSLFSGEWGQSALSKTEQNEWYQKFKMTDDDFPLIYYVKDSDKMNKNMGYEIFLNYHYGLPESTFPIEFNLNQCPDPVFYRKHQNEKNVYDRHGYDKDGYDKDGYDRRGYDKDGYNKRGYDRNGYDKDGYDSSGYDSSGYDRDGYDSSGYDSDGYDSSGYDSYGYDSDGNPDPYDYD